MVGYRRLSNWRISCIVNQVTVILTTLTLLSYTPRGFVNRILINTRMCATKYGKPFNLPDWGLSDMLPVTCTFVACKDSLKRYPAFFQIPMSSDLSSDLDELRVILAEVTKQLTDNPDDAGLHELDTLRNQLVELINIKEGQLLEEKKMQLLELVDAELQSVVANEPSADSANAHKVDVAEITDRLIGQRCSVPGWTASGKFILQSAVIFDLVDNDSSGTCQSSGRLRVFYAHPTRSSDVPCPLLLEHGACYRGIRCNYSHGTVVDVDEIHDWREPDAEGFLREGQPCLVKDAQSAHGLWRHARILHTDLESQCCVIRWGIKSPSLEPSSNIPKDYGNLENSVTSVPMDLVHLLDIDELDVEDQAPTTPSEYTYDDAESDESEEFEWPSVDDRSQHISISCQPSSSESRRNADTNGATSIRQAKVPFVFGGVLSADQILEPIPVNDPVTEADLGPDSNIAAWEAHTRGIGSQILRRLGYDHTQGLGKDGQGRIIPVALLLEKFQIRPRKWNHRPTLDSVVGNPRKSVRQRSGELQQSRPTSADVYTGGSVFKLLNSVMHRPDDKDHGNTSTPSPSQFCPISKTENPNIEHFKVQEKISSILKQIHHIQQSIARNDGRDRFVVAQMQHRLGTLKSELGTLRESERTLSAFKQRRLDDKKMFTF
ncbi:unnamed protein product [Dicrocoelium dendriticum]|nr:unnamed protein product [Dicrocoelium dendriticum]